MRAGWDFKSLTPCWIDSLQNYFPHKKTIIHAISMCLIPKRTSTPAFVGCKLIFMKEEKRQKIHNESISLAGYFYFVFSIFDTICSWKSAAGFTDFETWTSLNMNQKFWIGCEKYCWDLKSAAKQLNVLSEAEKIVYNGLKVVSKCTTKSLRNPRSNQECSPEKNFKKN